MKCGYLGPTGTYSELAAVEVAKNEEKIAFINFYEIFESLINNKIDMAIVPIENSIEGSVTEILDLLYKNDNLYIVSENKQKIEHRLAIKAGADISKIKDIYSHNQAIKQCSKFLSTVLKNANAHYISSTSLSGEYIIKKTDAGIVGAHFKKDGIVLLDNKIADTENNETRFVVVKKGVINKNSNKIFISFSSENKSGSLLKILQILKKYRLNMTKIESRPSKIKFGEYVFFVEFDGDISKSQVKKALEILKIKTLGYKLLGCY